jgi:hypothetical protein
MEGSTVHLRVPRTMATGEEFNSSPQCAVFNVVQVVLTRVRGQLAERQRKLKASAKKSSGRSNPAASTTSISSCKAELMPLPPNE